MPKTENAHEIDERDSGHPAPGALTNGGFCDPWVDAADPTQDRVDAAPVYEFFAPFAHLEGRYEWCRIRSPTHGVFDVFIVLGESTTVPAHVYVNDGPGRDFMRQRYPECTVTVLAHEEDLVIDESRGGRRVHGRLRSDEGPVREADLRFDADPDAMPRQVPYGGAAAPVWGSERFTCWGVDLVLDAQVRGVVSGPGIEERFDASPGILTVGSFGRIGRRA